MRWQAGDRPLPAPRVSTAGESALWVDPAEIPAGGDIGTLGRALAAGRHGERDELMAHTAAYSGLRWGELTALTIGQVDAAALICRDCPVSMGDKAYSSAANRSYLRERRIKAVIPVKEDQKNTAAAAAARAAARPPSAPDATRTATPSSAVSASSSSSVPSRPGMTSGSSYTRAPLTWPRSGSGYKIPSHDPRDTP